MKKETKRTNLAPDCKQNEKFRGNCCCNCENRIQVNCHPANTIAKGPASKKFSYVCLYGKEDNYASIMEWEHWLCEMHIRKKIKKNANKKNKDL